MKLIVGLGNPGREYARTRHNVGFEVVEALAARHGATWTRKPDAEIARWGQDAVLVKPQTFMNLSGAILKPYLRRETWSAAKDLLIIVDEVALPVGRFRLRAKGSAGGHNGLKSIEAAVGHQEYARLRIGVGPPEDRQRKANLADYVLDRIGKGERKDVEALFPDLVAQTDTWIRDGVELAMSRFNRKADVRDGT